MPASRTNTTGDLINPSTPQSARPAFELLHRRYPQIALGPQDPPYYYLDRARAHLTWAINSPSKDRTPGAPPLPNPRSAW